MLLANQEDASWMQYGNCNSSNRIFFFSVDKNHERAAIKICSSCSVKNECLEYAVANNIAHGVWGGTSEMRRRSMKRLRAQQRASTDQISLSA
jgi:WhiB family transcriptional regulator, redox-sensing transcriptional regulator